MAELKTQPNSASVDEFLNSIKDEKKKTSSRRILDIMEQASGEQPQLWGDRIVGFGRYHYKYASGREGDWFLTGFSPRKANLTLYITSGFDQFPNLLEKLGKFKTGSSCLYIKKIEDIDLNILEELIRASVDHMRKTNP
jgi:hypothetical protein